MADASRLGFYPSPSPQFQTGCDPVGQRLNTALRRWTARQFARFRARDPRAVFSPHRCYLCQTQPGLRLLLMVKQDSNSLLIFYNGICQGCDSSLSPEQAQQLSEELKRTTQGIESIIARELENQA